MIAKESFEIVGSPKTLKMGIFVQGLFAMESLEICLLAKEMLERVLAI